MNTDTSDRTVEIKTLPDMHVAFIRHVGPYLECGAKFGQLMGWAGPKGLLGPSTRILGVYHDDPDVTPPEKLRADCCMTVATEVSVEGDVQLQMLTPGECAVLTHRGPYTDLANSYKWLFGDWLLTSGRELGCSPPFEIYVNDPTQTPENELITEICVPLKTR